MSDRTRRYDLWPVRLAGAVLVSLALGLLVMRDINRSMSGPNAAVLWCYVALFELGAVVGLVMVLRRSRQVSALPLAEVDALCEQYLREEARHTRETAV